MNLTILFSCNDDSAGRWSRRDYCNSSDRDGIGVVRMQREQGECSPGRDVAIRVPSIHFCHIYQVVLDYPIPL